MARNDNYWREPAKLERVVTLVVDEFGTRFAMLQAGDADVIDLGSTADAVQVHPLLVKSATGTQRAMPTIAKS
jgi:ABC-type transport system substrate-binding protein